MNEIIIIFITITGPGDWGIIGKSSLLSLPGLLSGQGSDQQSLGQVTGQLCVAYLETVTRGDVGRWLAGNAGMPTLTPVTPGLQAGTSAFSGKPLPSLLQSQSGSGTVRTRLLSPASPCRQCCSSSLGRG